VAWIDLDGAVNVRDLGALPTGDGQSTVAGRLLRGDNLQDLSPADVRQLIDGIGVTTVIDLRSPYEVRAEGPGPLSGVASVRHAHHSVLPERGTATDAAAEPAADTDGSADAADPQSGAADAADPPSGATAEAPSPADAASGTAGIGDEAADSDSGSVFDASDALAIRRRDGALARYPDDVRVGYYIGYLEDRPDQVVAALRSIAQSPGAALVHCAAGKDRTGVVVALALTAAGVGRDAVIADYAATGERMAAVLNRLRSSPTYASDTNSRPDEDHMPRADTMAWFLDEIDASYGGVMAWLDQHGFGPADVAALRAKLLDP
jgi:protein-tyrosine phosphatase